MILVWLAVTTVEYKRHTIIPTLLDLVLEPPANTIEKKEKSLFDRNNALEQTSNMRTGKLRRSLFQDNNRERGLVRSESGKALFVQFLFCLLTRKKNIRPKVLWEMGTRVFGHINEQYSYDKKSVHYTFTMFSSLKVSMSSPMCLLKSWVGLACRLGHTPAFFDD